jgi:hypothetical protein
MHLKRKARKNRVRSLFENKLNYVERSHDRGFDYVMKDDTRIDGPWKDSDLEVPRQLREISNLYPWQEAMKDRLGTWDPRCIDVIIDEGGNNGKSIFALYCMVHGIAEKLPFMRSYRDIMRMVCCVGAKPAYIIDIPRAINKDRLYEMWGAIESIKNGIAYDDRYEYKRIVFDSPRVLVIMNTVPDATLMSADRWKIWGISSSKELVERDLWGAPLE